MLEVFSRKVVFRLSEVYIRGFGFYIFASVIDLDPYPVPAALRIKKPLSGPIISTAFRPKLRNGTIGPDSTLYNRCSLSHTPNRALFSAYLSLLYDSRES